MKDTELVLGLWNHCNNRCQFCYLQPYYNLPVDIKQHLKTCNDLLNSNFMENFKGLRILGGELFDGSIDQLKVRKEFEIIIQSIIKLLKEYKIERLNLLTNLIYKDNKDLKDILQLFKDNNLIDKVQISTSYDLFGRFSNISEQWWWNNINWIKETYPNLTIDIGMIMTQPFITTITKEWIDSFIEKTVNRNNIRFNELDVALDTDKYTSKFSNLFPKRHDFIQFLKKLKNWNYFDLLGIKDEQTNPYNQTLYVQYINVNNIQYPIYKSLKYIYDGKEKYKEDDYIDSNISMYDDIKKVLNIN